MTATLRGDLRGNAECAWDDFDPTWYVDHNYRVMRDDDRQIVQEVRNFFASEMDHDVPRRGIDVGSGANLYPALAMLPFCHEITLWERSRANVDWLRSEIGGYSQSWDPFWRMLEHKEPYRAFEKPREALKARARVHQGDVFKLPKRQWDVGTMFFVAESITERRREFQIAVHGFIHSLRPGALFAAAFMENSAGYTVGSHRFPAVAVKEVDVEHCLSAVARVTKTVTIHSNTPLRDGYDGMILALGKAGPTTS